MVTKYPTDVSGYLRQQRRWLRNVFLYGRKYGAADEVRASIYTSVIGAVMLAAPISFSIAGNSAFIPWFILLAHGLMSRLRYLLSASILLQCSLSWKHIAVLPLTLTLDFVAWAGALAEYVTPTSHSQW